MIHYVANLPFRYNLNQLGPHAVADAFARVGIPCKSVTVPMEPNGRNFGVAFVETSANPPLWRASQLMDRPTLIRTIAGTHDPSMSRSPWPTETPQKPSPKAPVRVEPLPSAYGHAEWSLALDPRYHDRFDTSYDGTGYQAGTCPVCERRPVVNGHQCERCIQRPRVVVSSRRVWKQAPWKGIPYRRTGYPITITEDYELPTELELDEGLRWLLEADKRGITDHRFREQYKRASIACRFYARTMNPDQDLRGTRAERFS